MAGSTFLAFEKIPTPQDLAKRLQNARAPR
jgi:hypothetical protein